MPTYRLGSSTLVHAPGLIAWAINGYAFPRDRAAILRVVTYTWPGLPDETARRLLSGDLAYRVNDDTIVIDVAETGDADALSTIADSTGRGDYDRLCRQTSLLAALLGQRDDRRRD